MSPTAGCGCKVWMPTADRHNRISVGLLMAVPRLHVMANPTVSSDSCSQCVQWLIEENLEIRTRGCHQILGSANVHTAPENFKPLLQFLVLNYYQTSEISQRRTSVLLLCNYWIDVLKRYLAHCCNRETCDDIELSFLARVVFLFTQSVQNFAARQVDEKPNCWM